MCECSNMAGYGPESFGKHHHKHCPLYATEKFPHLFYYEEAENCWAPAPDEVAELIECANQLEDGETMEIQFKRVDMTDAEYDAMPEC